MGTMARTAGLVVSGFFGIGFVALAMITLIPAGATQPNHLGYYGVCSFAPNSTLALLVMAVASIVIAFKIRAR